MFLFYCVLIEYKYKLLLLWFLSIGENKYLGIGLIIGYWFCGFKLFWEFCEIDK